MVGDLPPHALETAMKPLREGIARGPWPSRHLLVVPLANPGPVTHLASHLAGRSGLQVSTTPQALKPSDAWAFISSAWNRVRDIGATSSPVAAAPSAPEGSIAFPTPVRPPAQPVAPLPMQPMPPTRRAAALATGAQDPWQKYARQCIEITGMVSCCVFELATQRTFAHAGARPGPASLATQGSALYQASIDAAKAMGLPGGPPDIAVTLSGHHLILRAIPGHPGLALHAVLDSHAANLTLVRMKLQRLDPEQVAGTAALA
jgi:hypothetical protein